MENKIEKKQNTLQVEKANENWLTKMWGFNKDTMDFCEMLAKSTMVPVHYQQNPTEKPPAKTDKKFDVFVAIQHGLEIGLPPLQSLQSIAVVNGKPTLYGDVIISLVRSSGVCEYIQRGFDTKNNRAFCISKRKGDPNPYTAYFSMDDAKRAGLTDRQTWKRYPERMAEWRAVSWCLRHLYADILGGLEIHESMIGEEPIVDAEVVPEVPEFDESKLLDPISEPKPTESKQTEPKQTESKQIEPTEPKQTEPTEPTEPKQIRILIREVKYSRSPVVYKIQGIDENDKSHLFTTDNLELATVAKKNIGEVCCFYYKIVDGKELVEGIEKNG